MEELRIAGVTAEIRNEQLPNSRQELYRDANPLGSHYTD
jgi:hypothetical protein